MPVHFPLAQPPANANRKRTRVTRELDKTGVALAAAFNQVRDHNPHAWGVLAEALHEFLDPEAAAFERAPPAILQTSQGRVQVANEILGLLDNATEVVERWKTQQGKPPMSGSGGV
jgi:hypothetical protein